ncbi:MAG: serpin family protein [Oscillospiraceae bacterium]|nr:serpin family protein [Oscillospiraceae bacterium]
MKRIFACLLLAALVFQLFGCAAREAAPGETALTAAQQTTTEETEMEQPATERIEDVIPQDAAADFALALLRSSEDGMKNCVLSPYSILTALAMTENGADGETLRQFETLFGMSCDELNAYLQACIAKEGEEVAGANSIWLRDEPDLALKEDFQKLTQELFGAEVFTAPFDAATVERINAWVSEHTKERIKQIIDTLDSASMVLINALSFDAKWERPYAPNEVKDGTFTASDGTVQQVQMLCAREGLYLDDGMATGFLKPYEGGKYSFVALLPNEDTDVQTYLASLTGTKLLAAIHAAAEQQVMVSMPKLKTETSLQLAELLFGMGLTDAFTNAADFSRMTSAVQCIDEVIHKTYLSIDEEGTEAAAATAVVMTRSARPIQMPTLTLDRPYLMAIVDNETDCLLFLGVINQIP